MKWVTLRHPETGGVTRVRDKQAVIDSFKARGWVDPTEPSPQPEPEPEQTAAEQSPSSPDDEHPPVRSRRKN